MLTDIRLRRNRRTPAIRDMVQETRLHPSDFVVPLFVIEGTNLAVPITSMPGIHRFSIDSLLKKIEHLAELGIQSVALFPAIENSLRTDAAEEAWNPTAWSHELSAL
jgi:porphobilinogen synthase